MLRKNQQILMELAVTIVTQIGAARYRDWGVCFDRFATTGDAGSRF